MFTYLKGENFIKGLTKTMCKKKKYLKCKIGDIIDSIFPLFYLKNITGTKVVQIYARM